MLSLRVCELAHQKIIITALRTRRILQKVYGFGENIEFLRI